jgi:hypothetical protein
MDHETLTPDSESPYLDAEDFDIVFAVYAEHPSKAFILAQHLDHLKGLIQRGPQDALEAIACIDLAIARLYPHTDFHTASYKLYLSAVAGKLLDEQDPITIVRELEKQSS